MSAAYEVGLAPRRLPHFPTAQAACPVGWTGLNYRAILVLMVGFFRKVALLFVKFVIIPVVGSFILALSIDSRGRDRDSEWRAYEANRRREDPLQLTRRSLTYSDEGIAILIRSTSPVSRIQRRAASGPSHYDVAFRVLETSVPLHYIALVPYDFCPDGEWGLQVFNQAGHWYSDSPYFPHAPPLSSDDWSHLFRSRKGTPIDPKRWFPDFEPQAEIRRAGW